MPQADLERLRADAQTLAESAEAWIRCEDPDADLKEDEETVEWWRLQARVARGTLALLAARTDDGSTSPSGPPAAEYQERAKRALGLMAGGVGDPNDGWRIAQVASALESAAREAAERAGGEERERCAKLADESKRRYERGYDSAVSFDQLGHDTSDELEAKFQHGGVVASSEIAAAIRSTPPPGANGGVDR